MFLKESSSTIESIQCPVLVQTWIEGTSSTPTREIVNSAKRFDVIAAYRRAKDLVLRAGFGEEISWQTSVNLSGITESDFLREHAWVTLSAGMKERVVRNLFQAISSSFYYWESARVIAGNEPRCRRLALTHFNNIRKIEAIIVTARSISSKGFNSFKQALCQDALGTLQSLPYIGPVTCYHLAKNIGLQVAKPDRHLTRLAYSVGYSDVQLFCKHISLQSGDSIPVVDIVLWRFASITEGYLDFFLNAATNEKA